MKTSGLDNDDDPTNRSLTQQPVGERSPLLPKNDPTARQNGYSTYEVQDDVPYKNVNARQFYAMFICILMAYTISYFDSTFMASSHPVITSYFHASHVASWLSTTFFLSSTISRPLYGRLSDIFGRRSVYLWAMAIFAVGTLWCATAQSIEALIFARAVAGLGTGGMTSLSEILMAATIKTQHRGVFQSYLNMAYGAGTGLGAALGGILCDKLGWRAAFGLQVPLIAAFTLVAWWSVPRNLGPCLAQIEGSSVREALKSFDFLGALTLTICITGLILGINLGGNVFPWSHPVVIASLLIFASTVPLLVWVENRATSPVLPMTYITKIPFANFMWSNVLSPFVIQAVLFNVPLILQVVREISPTDAGMYMLTPLLGLTLASVLVGFWIKITGILKFPVLLGAILLLIGVLPLGFLDNNRLPDWSMALLIPWAHIGHGFLSTASTVSLLALTQSEEQAVVTTTLGLSRNLGSMTGIAVAGWALQNFLLVYLPRTITGDEEARQGIMSKVRKSVRAIQELDPIHKAEAIDAYALALRNTFLCFLAAGFVACCLVFPLRLPRLKTANAANAQAKNEESNV